jgi:hypothetical protein
MQGDASLLKRAPRDHTAPAITCIHIYNWNGLCCCTLRWFTGGGPPVSHQGAALRPGFPIWSWYPAEQYRRRVLISEGSDKGNPCGPQ